MPNGRCQWLDNVAGRSEAGPGNWAPLADVSGTSDAYVVEVDLPGVKRNDVTVDLIADGVLTDRVPKTEPEKPRRIAITGK